MAAAFCIFKSKIRHVSTYLYTVLLASSLGIQQKKGFLHAIYSTQNIEYS